MPTSKKDPTQVDALIRFFQNNTISAVLIFLCLVLIGFSKVTESGNQILRTFGVVKEYDVNQATERGKFSAQLIENIWNRMFWMRNYAERVRRKSPLEEQEKSWQKLTDATEKWSSCLMNYYIGLDEYYPDGKKRQILEEKIQHMISSSAKLCVNLKYDLPKLDSVVIDMRTAQIQLSVDSLNYALYSFVDQPPPKH
jgi:hypothetical protein